MTDRPGNAGLTYRDAGVDLAVKDAFTERLLALTRRTYGPEVIDVGPGFAGLYALGGAGRLFDRRHRDPVLVACTDGVGTKVLLAAELQRYDTVGIDLVAMSVNDLIVCGAEPLFFLDYIAVGAIDPTRAMQLIEGITAGCLDAGCALIGGETAEMPGVYQGSHFDLAGFAVGIVDRRRLLGPSLVRRGDVVVGCASTGVHSNGFSLVRRIVAQAGLDLRATYEELGAPLGEVLLRPTRIYAAAVRRALEPYRQQRLVRAMAHITGSGLPGNLPRALPPATVAVLHRDRWPVPPIFGFLQRHGGVADAEMTDVFNLGLGFCCVVAPRAVDAVIRRLRLEGVDAWPVGEIRAAAAGAEPAVEFA
jgi:phosphoribosylformylglycinamidine cyclo-ligase